MIMVEVDKDKCTGCEECINICPQEVVDLVDGKSEPTRADECVDCQSCVEACPESAITVNEI